MYHVMGNGHGRVTEPKDDHLSGRILGMIPKDLPLGFFIILIKVVGIRISGNTV